MKITQRKTKAFLCSVSIIFDNGNTKLLYRHFADNGEQNIIIGFLTEGRWFYQTLSWAVRGIKAPYFKALVTLYRYICQHRLSQYSLRYLVWADRRTKHNRGLVRRSKGRFENKQTLIPDDAILSIADYYGTPGARDLAHGVKKGDFRAIVKMAWEMSALIPDGASLVPMPSHYGFPTTTALLAKELARIKHGYVHEVLIGEPREASYQAKNVGHAVDIRFRLKGQIPWGKIYIIDNVIDTGVTAKAALAVIPEAKIAVHSVVKTDALLSRELRYG